MEIYVICQVCFDRNNCLLTSGSDGAVKRWFLPSSIHQYHSQTPWPTTKKNSNAPVKHKNNRNYIKCKNAVSTETKENIEDVENLSCENKCIAFKCKKHEEYSFEKSKQYKKDFGKKNMVYIYINNSGVL